MKLSINKIVGFITTILFLVIFIISFVIYPDVGEKILYGKHPPNKESEEIQKYSEIIKTKNYKCMESASLKSNGDMREFVKKFNECNT